MVRNQRTVLEDNTGREDTDSNYKKVTGKLPLDGPSPGTRKRKWARKSTEEELRQARLTDLNYNYVPAQERYE